AAPFLAAVPPTAAVNVHDQRRRLDATRLWKVNVELQLDIARFAVHHVGQHLGCVGTGLRLPGKTPLGRSTFFGGKDCEAAKENRRRGNDAQQHGVLRNGGAVRIIPCCDRRVPPEPANYRGIGAGSGSDSSLSVNSAGLHSTSLTVSNGLFDERPSPKLI